MISLCYDIMLGYAYVMISLCYDVMLWSLCHDKFMLWYDAMICYVMVCYVMVNYVMMYYDCDYFMLYVWLRDITKHVHDY